MRFRGPLADSYPAAVALVVCALVPFLALTSAINPLTTVLAASVPLSQQSLQLTTGMSNAAYAFGTVLALQLAVRLPGRRMLLVYAALFSVASVLTALRPTTGFFVGGHIVQGLTTSLMLISAVPPLVTGFSARKMPITAIVMNMCVFGAVALGPVVGGVQASTGHWRALFWIVAGLGALALLFAVLTYEDQPPQDRSAPWDWVAIVLAAGGSAAAFFGASELETHRFLSTIVFLPLVAGVAAIVVLIVHQSRMDNPLMPVRQLATSIPITGILIAMCAAAASVGVVELAGTVMQDKASPSHTAMLFWPEFGGALATALLFGAVLRTRAMSLLPFGGMTALAGGAVVLTGLAHGPNALLAIGSGLVGVGVGASVAPALFMASFSVRSSQIARVFALVELLRGFAAFLVAPVLMHIAMTVSPTPSSAVAVATWACLAIAAAGGLAGLYLFALGRVRLQGPDLDRWLEGETPAWDSPPIAAGIRAPAPSAARDGRSADGRMALD
jgi:MFS family permease